MPRNTKLIAAGLLVSLLFVSPFVSEVIGENCRQGTQQIARLGYGIWRMGWE